MRSHDLPVSIRSRIASVYSRASYVRCLGSPPRSGSVTLFGSVTTPLADEDPIYQEILKASPHIWGTSKSFSRELSPVLDWQISKFNKSMDFFYANWEEYSGFDISRLRAQALELLQKGDALFPLVSTKGKVCRLVAIFNIQDSLPQQDQLTYFFYREVLYNALFQNVFSERHSPLRKSVMMLEKHLLLYDKCKIYLEAHKHTTWENVHSIIQPIISDLQVARFQVMHDTLQLIAFVARLGTESSSKYTKFISVYCAIESNLTDDPQQKSPTQNLHVTTSHV
jgi:V-type H+-transporting ATPase subunit A